MGFSPVDGLVMGTRCGDVDPSAVLYIAEKEGMNFADINTMINKKSGVEAVSGVSSDMRDIDAAYDAGNERAILARDMYYDRVKQYVGKYAALMGGVDLVIFTGGVGENSWELREGATSGLEYMGIALNDDVNRVARGTDTVISADNSKVKVAVVATNEELVIATDTYNLTK
jgi:acetate kinase